MFKNFNTIIYWSPIVIIFIFVLIFPWLFSAFFPSYNVFELLKATFLWPATLILLFFTLLKVFTFKIEVNKYISSYFLVVIILFLIFLLLNTFLVADNSNLALLGDYYRRQGLLTQVSYVFWFCLTLLNLLLFKNVAQNIKYLLFSVSLSGFFVAIYGFFQYLGFDYFTWQEPVMAGRVISSIGQPNFLASFLILTLFSSIALFFKSKFFYWRLFILINIFFHFLVIYLTSSRAALLSLFIVVILSFFIFIKKKRLRLIFTFSALFACLFVFYFSNSGLVSSFDFNSGSIFARSQFYSASMKAISKKPFIGYGLEQSGSQLVSYYQPEWALFSTVNNYPNRAHNIILDIGLNFGFFGIIIYSSLVFLFIYFLIYLNKEKKNWFILLSLGLLAYIISLMFGFPSLATSFYFWLILAILTAWFLNNYYLQSREQLPFKTRKYSISRILLIFILFFNAFFIYIAIDNSIKTIRADRKFFICYNSLALSNLANFNYCWQSLEISNDRVQSNYYQNFIINYVIDNHHNFKGELKDDILNYFDNIYYSLENKSYSSKTTKTKLSCFLKKDDFKERFDSLIAISPKRPEVYRNKANCYFYLNEHKEAINNYKQALNLLPDLYDERINKEHQNSLKYYSHLLNFAIGQSLASLKDYDKSIEYFKKAYYNYPDNISIWQNIAQLNYLQNNYNLAIDNYLYAFRIDSENYIWPFKISEIYDKLGDMEKSEIYYQKASSLINN